MQYGFPNVVLYVWTKKGKDGKLYYDRSLQMQCVEAAGKILFVGINFLARFAHSFCPFILPSLLLCSFFLDLPLCSCCCSFARLTLLPLLLSCFLLSSFFLLGLGLFPARFFFLDSRCRALCMIIYARAPRLGARVRTWLLGLGFRV
jgi:hypothetical protein